MDYRQLLGAADLSYLLDLQIVA